jgi:hypothetical protein
LNSRAIKNWLIRLRANLQDSLISLWALASRYWGELLRPGAFIAGVVVTLAGVGSYMQARLIPKESTWEVGAPARTLLAVVGILATVFTFLVIRGYMRRLRKDTEQDQFLEACRTIFIRIQKETGIPAENLGVHAWTVTGFPGGKHLVSRATFRTHRRPLPPIRWMKGKGAIGRCWASGIESVDDLSHYRNAFSSEAGFEALSEEDRLGLNWQDYAKTRDFTAIWTAPIFRGPEAKRRFGGCISADVVEHPNAAGLLDQFSRQEKVALEEILAVCHTVLP